MLEHQRREADRKPGYWDLTSIPEEDDTPAPDGFGLLVAMVAVAAGLFAYAVSALIGG